MPIVVFDTGFLLSLAVNRDYANAARLRWAGHDFWVPASVQDELRIRQRFPRADIPPELPTRALGIIGSDVWTISIVTCTPAEDLDTRMLQERIGGPGNTDNAGECEATVLIAHRDPTALLAFDDAASLPVLARYVKEKTLQNLRYVHTSTVIERLVQSGQIDDKQQDAFLAQLSQKRRPII